MVKEENNIANGKKKIFEKFQDNVTSLLDISKIKFKINIAEEMLKKIYQDVQNGKTLEVLDAENIETNKNIYNQEELNSPTFSYQNSFTLTQEDINSIKRLLEEKIIRRNLSDLRDEIADWLKIGVSFQNEQNDEKCLLCNQPLKSSDWHNRIEKINQMVEKDAEFEKKENLLNKYLMLIENTLNNKPIILEDADKFYEVYKNKFNGIKNLIQDDYKELSDLLKILKNRLLEKMKDKRVEVNIVSEILLNGFSLYDSLIYYVNKVSNDFAELKKIYNENGTYSTKIKSDKDIALGKITLHCAQSFITAIDKNNETYEKNQKDMNKYSGFLNKNTKKLIQKTEELANTEAPIEEMNGIIQAIIGRNKFYFEKDGVEGQYKILRMENGEWKDAFNLSEGEKNIISFAFFVTYIKEKIADSIIVIDDPISSLDNTYFFNILNLILSSKISKNPSLCQMFLLTHNFYFFRKVRKNIKGTECYELDASGKCIVDAKGNKQRKFCKHWQKNNLEDKQIYQIVKKGSNSNIVPPSLYLLKYNSEFIFIYLK